MNEEKILTGRTAENFMSANWHVLDYEYDKENNYLRGYLNGKLVAACEYATDNQCYSKYLVSRYTEKKPVSVAIPVPAKIRNMMWYCPFDKELSLYSEENICQVKVMQIFGTTSMSPHYIVETADRRKFTVLMQEIYSSYEEAVAFVEKANKQENPKQYAEIIETDWDKNMENKERFPYILSFNLKINHKVGTSKICSFSYNSDWKVGCRIALAPEWRYANGLVLIAKNSNQICTAIEGHVFLGNNEIMLFEKHMNAPFHDHAVFVKNEEFIQKEEDDEF